MEKQASDMLTKDEQERILNRIALMKNMTCARGCTPGEADTAALKIGQLIQQYDLSCSFTVRHTPENRQSNNTWSRTYRNNEDVYEFGEVIVLSVSEKALFLQRTSDAFSFWIPRSQCRQGCEQWERENSGTLYVSAWWAKKQGWM